MEGIGVWWVQPFKKYWLLSFKIAKITLTHILMCFYSNTSFFLLPWCVVEGGSPDPKDPPPLDPPLRMFSSLHTIVEQFMKSSCVFSPAAKENM